MTKTGIGFTVDSANSEENLALTNPGTDKENITKWANFNLRGGAKFHEVSAPKQSRPMAGVIWQFSQEVHLPPSETGCYNDYRGEFRRSFAHN